VAPIVNGLEKQYAGRVDFQRVNVLDEQNAALMKQFGFSATPEIYLLDRQDKVLAFWDQAVPASQMASAFDQALKQDR
jgi:thioredoxin-like negative regulator of GroEL